MLTSGTSLTIVEMHDNVISHAGHLVNQISVVRADIVISKLPRGDLALEHDIHLLKGTVLGLWQAEEAPHGGEQRQAAPEEGLQKCKSA